jgi:hypothetical protein
MALNGYRKRCFQIKDVEQKNGARVIYPHPARQTVKQIDSCQLPQSRPSSLFMVQVTLAEHATTLYMKQPS